MAKKNIPRNDHNQKPPAKALRQKEEVAKSPDPRIDEDFKGFPHAPAREELIRPESVNEHKTAGTFQKEDQQDEQLDPHSSDGSAGAFEQTEQTREERNKRQQENNY